MRTVCSLFCLGLAAACGGEEFSARQDTAGAAGSAGAPGGGTGGLGASGAPAGLAGSAGGSAGGPSTACVSPQRSLPAAADGEEVIAVTDEADAKYPCLDEAYVYWTTQHSVWRVPKQGGCLQRIAAGGAQLQGLAVREGFAYFADSASGKVRRVALDAAAEELIASDQAGVQTVAVDDSHVYWAGPNMVRRRAIDGSGVVQDLAPGAAAQAYAVALDATHVYWASQGGAVYRAPKEGGSQTVLDTTVGLVGTEPVYLALFANRFYWSFRTDVAGGVRTKTKNGAASTLSAISDPKVEGIALDGQFAYWARAEAAGGVRKGPAALGSVSEHVAGQSRPVGVAVDASHVYWTNYGDASIRRAMK